MKASEKKLEILLNFVPIGLILISILYIIQFCGCKNLKQESLNEYSIQLDQNIKRNSIQNKYYLNADYNLHNKNQNIILSDNKSITIRKLSKKNFSMVLF